MARYRSALPQLDGSLFLADGGIETTLIFHDGLELPDFGAYDVLKRPEGVAALYKYFRAYAALAKRFGTGLILESATWRANPDWANRIGYSRAALADANRQAVRILEEIRNESEGGKTRVVISGCVGPRGDGYSPLQMMSSSDAATYHQEQVDTFASSAADLVTAITMNYVEEAMGIVQAAQRAGMPVAIAFTVETDGRLPTGQTLADAIGQVDQASSNYPAYYMMNCAHPNHFEAVLRGGEAWRERIRGVRANASRRSHAELNESPDLDIGDPAELGADYARLTTLLPQLNVMGGCCGTDDRHIEQIATACAQLFR